MLRLAILTLAVSALIPLGPLGCPPTELPSDSNTPVERGTVLTETEVVGGTATVGQVVTLRAMATPSVAGAAVFYAWLQTEGPGVPIQNADSATASFTAPSVQVQRRLTFTVTTRDETGAVGRADVSVQIAADPNFGQPTSQATGPKANAGADQVVLPGDTVTLDGSKSTGNNLTYHWREVSGATVTLSATDTAQTQFVAPAFDPNSPNILLFELAITDASSRSMTDRVQVKLRDPSLSDHVMLVDTSLGKITVELDPNAAPITVANFLQYVDDGFFDGTIFHRVIPGFVIQGGGFLPGLIQKQTRPPIVNEANNGLSNVRGSIAMARTSDPNSATCQFFINVANNIAGGDGQSNLDTGGVSPEGYAVFGKVTAGMDVADAIAAVATGTQQSFSDVPNVDVLINSIKRAPVSN